MVAYVALEEEEQNEAVTDQSCSAGVHIGWQVKTVFTSCDCSRWLYEFIASPVRVLCNVPLCTLSSRFRFNASAPCAWLAKAFPLCLNPAL